MRTKLPPSFQYTPTSGGGRFGPTVAGPARLTTVGVAGVGSIIALTIESGTLAAFSALRPSTLVSKFVAPLPPALAALILARITSSEMPELTMAITSWLVSRRLTPGPSSLNAGRIRRKHKTNAARLTRPGARPRRWIGQLGLVLPIASSRQLVAVISEAPQLKECNRTDPKRTAI